MLYRLLTFAVFLLMGTQVVYGAQCLDVFPSGYNQATGSTEQLTNFPANNSASYLTHGTTVPRGDNLYLGSTLGNKDEVYVGGISGGETTARVYFRTAVSWQNVKINQGGNPEDLIIVVDGSLSITGGQTVINAIIYVKGALTVTGAATINGALTSVGSGGGSANYNSSYITNADFNGMCDGASVPVAEYRFDETSYSGAANEVLDSVGGFHGQSFSTQPSSGKLCNAANLSASGTADYIKLDESILHGKTDFTVSLWAKSSKTTNQSILSGAGSSGSNEALMWFTNSTNFRPFIKNSNNGNLGISSIADGSWHHLVWTRSGSQNCLYRDTVLQGCKTLSTSSLNIQSLLLGQEQDSVGGRFSSSQAWEGLLDEVVVFDKAISASEITQIYTNQNSGLGYDGSARTCPVEPDPIPIANFRFDECSYEGTGNEVIDQLGNYSGTSHGGVNTILTGNIEGAVDLSSAAHHVETLIPISGNFSVSTWFKKPTATSGSRYFVLGAMQSGGDLLYLDRNNSWRWGVYNASSGAVNGSYSFSSLDNNWHHMVLVYTTNHTDLYIDGTLVDSVSKAPAGSLKFIGTSYDGVSSSSPQGFRSPLDEFAVYQQVLSSSQISTIYTNQNAGNNYDGTTRDPVDCNILPLANFQMEESSWTGSTAEVIDQTGSFNATAINGATTNTSAPALTGNPGTCGYGTFDGVNDYIELPNSFENLQTSFTVTAWIKPSNVNAGSRIFIDDENNGQKGFGFSLGDPGNGKLRFYSRGVSPISVDTTSSITPNIWTFVTAVHDSNAKTRKIYINGVAQTVTGGSTSNTYTGTWGTDSGPATIGGETDLGETNNRFTGDMDEVRVYKGALSSSQIATIYAETHPCVVPSIDHFEIIHDGTALTCDAETVTIKACTNAFGSACTLSSDSVTLDVNATGSATVTNNITFTGTTTTDIAYTTPETTVLSITNPTIVPSNAAVCNDNSAGSCNLVFADAGFRFLNGASGTSETISNQIAGTAFPIRIQAVENSNGVCTGVFTGNKTIQLAQENINPAGTSGLKFNVNGSDIDKYPSITSGVSLNFGSSSIATLPSAYYKDAGQIKLRASYSSAGVNLLGNSNSFWVRPNKLVITDTTGTTQKAGVNFDLVVTAYNSLGTNTSNITQNYSPGQLQFVAQRTAPTLLTSVDGAFTYTGSSSMLSTESSLFVNDVNLSTFSNGISSNQAKYSEVGQISVDVQDRDFGGQGITVPSSGADVLGRFTPDHFKQRVFNAGSLTSSCSLGGTTFAYSGQQDDATLTRGTINYLIDPVIEITAYNADDNVTQNYFEDVDGSPDDFMNLSASDIIISPPTTDNVAVGIDSNKLPIVGTVSTGTLSQNNLDSTDANFGNLLSKGTLHYKLSSSDHFYYQRSANALVANFDANFTLPITSIIDSDLITATSTVDVQNLSGVNIRFGRLALENSYGPETENLPQEFITQYYDGSNFVVNSDDNCTRYDVAKMTLSNKSLAPTAKIGTTGNFVAGTTKALQITAPGAGNQGEMDVTYESMSWLKFDWSNTDSLADGPYTENPSAVATFGLFRGNDRIISWREVGN